jgi:hypothetical protein
LEFCESGELKEVKTNRLSLEVAYTKLNNTGPGRKKGGLFVEYIKHISKAES